MLMDNVNHRCQPEEIAAYLDGELDASLAADFERHLLECRICTVEFKTQQRFILELDASLSLTPDPPVPSNFAQIVTAYAESDMRRVRKGDERKRALRFCLALAIVSFALLGAAAIKTVLFSGRTLAHQALGIFGLLWTTLYDAAVGLTVISRVISGGLVPESPFAGLAALLLALCVVLLSLLISSYHRHHEMRLSE